MRRLGVLIFSALLFALPAKADDLLDFEKHVRTTDATMRQLIRDARASSPTFRRLIDRLERSDVIVYVTRHYDMSPGLDGQLNFMSKAGGSRYVNVRVAWDRPAQRLVSTLAHELQHAVEIADAADVVDEASLARAYTRFGRPGSFNVRSMQAFETPEAVEVGHRVWLEYGAAAADD
jgi:hypothetical protein